MLSDFDLEGKNKFQKAAYYLKYYGMGYTLKKALRKFGVPISEESEYMTWCRRNGSSKVDLEHQRGSDLAKEISFVIVSEKGTNPETAGWHRQTCKNLSFYSLKEDTKVSDLLKETEGEFYVFSGESIKVMPEYLFEISKAILGEEMEPVSKIRPQNDAPVDMLYTDEDNLCGKKRFRPFFKPDASLNFLLNFQYMGRLLVIGRTLLETLEKEQTDIKLSGNDWYDLALQAFRFTNHVYHIPKVLFSNCVSESEKNTLVRSRDLGQKKCIEHYLKTENIGGRVKASDVVGFYHVEYELAVEPLVSIIIPNKDHIEDLELCLNSLKKSDYTNYEVIIAENNSEKEETFAYYEKISKEDTRIKIVTWKGEFNYSAINNFAVKSAGGDLLLFLNNDTEFMEENTLRELVISTLKPGIGAAGAMLYYGDKTIQHGGIIMGMGGFAAHGLWSLGDRDEKYYPFSLCEREVSGNTGACLIVRKQAFEAVGGMGEDFVVALNDVDLCMKIRAMGYGILFNPYAKLFHYESKSRGYEDTMEKQARFQGEIHRFQEKWEHELQEKDPYYNPNLTLHRADYSMDI